MSVLRSMWKKKKLCWQTIKTLIIMRTGKVMKCIVTMMLLCIGILPVMADTSDPTVQNSGPVELGDGVILSKTAKSVPGYANKWEVTLRIESPKTKKHQIQ